MPDARDWLDAKAVRRTEASLHYGVAAAKQAVADSGFEITDENRTEVGVVFGSGAGGPAGPFRAECSRAGPGRGGALEVFFPGAAHAQDNIVVWFPGPRILTGCRWDAHPLHRGGWQQSAARVMYA
jgi:hypothetical protein